MHRGSEPVGEGWQGNDVRLARQGVPQLHGKKLATEPGRTTLHAFST